MREFDPIVKEEEETALNNFAGGVVDIADLYGKSPSDLLALLIENGYIDKEDTPKVLKIMFADNA